MKAALGAFYGGAGNYLFGTLIPPTGIAAGDALIDESVISEWVIRVLVALIVGGILSLIVGFVRNEIAKKRSK